MSMLVAPAQKPRVAKVSAPVRLMAALTNRRAKRANEVNGQVSTVLPLRLPGGKRLVRSAEGAIWANVNGRRHGQRLYVHGHLLNQHLGGPVDTTTNLTPINFSMNKRHSSQVEATLKKLVGTMSNPRWFYYEVNVVYSSARRAFTPAEVAANVHPDEGLLTTGFKCKWHELEPNPKNPAKLHTKPGGKKLDEVTISHNNKPAPGV